MSKTSPYQRLKLRIDKARRKVARLKRQDRRIYVELTRAMGELGALKEQRQKLGDPRKGRTFPHGVCPICKRDIPVNRFGTFWRHFKGPRGWDIERCPGSSLLPVPRIKTPFPTVQLNRMKIIGG